MNTEKDERKIFDSTWDRVRCFLMEKLHEMLNYYWLSILFPFLRLGKLAACRTILIIILLDENVVSSLILRCYARMNGVWGGFIDG